jgi:hypothetical protein
MNTQKQIELIKSWGFKSMSNDNTMYSRKAPNAFTEIWSINSPDEIDFYNSLGNHTHSHPIHWSVIAKHFD